MQQQLSHEPAAMLEDALQGEEVAAAQQSAGTADSELSAVKVKLHAAEEALRAELAGGAEWKDAVERANQRADAAELQTAAADEREEAARLRMEAAEQRRAVAELHAAAAQRELTAFQQAVEDAEQRAAAAAEHVAAAERRSQAAEHAAALTVQRAEAALEEADAIKEQAAREAEMARMQVEAACQRAQAAEGRAWIVERGSLAKALQQADVAGQKAEAAARQVAHAQQSAVASERRAADAEEVAEAALQRAMLAEQHAETVTKRAEESTVPEPQQHGAAEGNAGAPALESSGTHTAAGAQHGTQPSCAAPEAAECGDDLVDEWHSPAPQGPPEVFSTPSTSFRPARDRSTPRTFPRQPGVPSRMSAVLSRARGSHPMRSWQTAAVAEPEVYVTPMGGTPILHSATSPSKASGAADLSRFASSPNPLFDEPGSKECYSDSLPLQQEEPAAESTEQSLEASRAQRHATRTPPRGLPAVRRLQLGESEVS